MLYFGQGKIAKQLADAGIRGAGRRLLIETAGLFLHLNRLPPHRLYAKGANLPERPPLDIATDIVPADERDMVAELFDKHVDQHSTVLVFLLSHVEEHTSRVGVIALKPLGEVGVDAPVLLLVADRQRQDFTFSQVGK